MKHKPDQAFGHREVFCFFLAELLFADSGADDGARAIGRAQPATGSSTTIANSAAPTVSALTLFAALTRARETAPIPARSDADRPAPAGWAALRLLADVDISF